MEKRLKIGEVVWTKIRGFPWWPGVIGKIEESTCPNQETKIKVHFIGDPSHAEVAISKIEKFEKKFEEFSKTKKRSLLNSITLAKKIIKGEITFNNHLKEKDNIIKKKPRPQEKKHEEKESEIDEDTSTKEKRILRNKRKRKISSSSDAEISNQKKSSHSSEEGPRGLRRNIISRRGSRKRFPVSRESSDDEEENSSCSGGENSEITDSEDGSEDSCDTNEDLAEKLEQKIKDLVFFKIELPSATSNKSIISTLDEIERIIRQIKHDSLHEIVKDLMQFLICLTTNKNQNVSIKASTLSGIIQEKIVEEVFNIQSEENNEQPESGEKPQNKQLNSLKNFEIILPSNFGEEFFIIKDYTDKDLDSLHEIIQQNLNSKKNLQTVNLLPPPSTPQKRKSKNFNIPKRRDTKETINVSGNTSNGQNFKNNLNTCNDKSKEILNLKLDKSKEEESNLSEISLNSDKTDWEDKCLHRQKFITSPLAKSDVYNILCEYFDETKTEDEFLEHLSNGCLFNCLEKNKNLKPVKNHYMRRRVCMKLFKVFERLLKKVNIENEIIKNLSIYLELKARDGDPDMSEKYRGYISYIFNKIKDKLIINTSIVTNISELEI